jgi:hypothetical protein
MKRIALALAGLLGLAGCAAVDVADYAQEQPELDLARYFSGTVDADGMFQDRSGKVVKRFHVVIEGHWEGSTGTLDEQFTYADGSHQQRVWTLTRLDAHRFSGCAADVVGEARGEAWGNALRWRYVLALPVDGKVYEVNFDDWMVLINDKVMLNRAVMSKFGFRLGEVTLSFRRREPS